MICLSNCDSERRRSGSSRAGVPKFTDDSEALTSIDGLALAEHRILLCLRMTRNAQTIATEAIALAPAERAEVAVAILDSFPAPTFSDDEVRELLKRRSADLASGKDRGVSFEEIFCEPL